MAEQWIVGGLAIAICVGLGAFVADTLLGSGGQRRGIHWYWAAQVSSGVFLIPLAAVIIFLDFPDDPLLFLPPGAGIVTALIMCLRHATKERARDD